MIDLLFIEIGAVVTEILGRNRCTIEPWCQLKSVPTYGRENRVEVDFTLMLEETLRNRGVLLTVGVAAQRAMHDRIEDHYSAHIGTEWPGGGYHGVVSFRDELVRTDATLARAVSTLPGQPWEYQFVSSIDEETGEIVQRYHGFHAQVVGEEDETLVLEIVQAGKSVEPSASRRTVRYDPRDTKTFYSGELVAENLVRGGRDPRSTGAVFIAADALPNFTGLLPKLPPSLGL